MLIGDREVDAVCRKSRSEASLGAERRRATPRRRGRARRDGELLAPQPACPC
jgi:hypothetical protein